MVADHGKYVLRIFRILLLTMTQTGVSRIVQPAEPRHQLVGIPQVRNWWVISGIVDRCIEYPEHNAFQLAISERVFQRPD